MKKILTHSTLINPNQHKIIATKLKNAELSVTFHLKILEKRIEKFNTSNSIPQKIIALNQFIANTGIIRDALVNKLSLLKFGETFDNKKSTSTFINELKNELSQNENNKFKQIIDIIEANSQENYGGFRNEDMHFNGPHSKSRSLDLMMLLLDPDYSHYAIEFINGNIFSILPLFKQLHDEKKDINQGKSTNQNLKEKVFFREQESINNSKENLKKRVTIFEKSLLKEWSEIGNNSPYFNITPDTVSCLFKLDEFSESAISKDAIHLLMSIKLLIFISHQATFSHNIEDKDSFKKAMALNQLIYSIPQLNEALQRFLYLIEKGELLEGRNTFSQLLTALKDKFPEETKPNYELSPIEKLLKAIVWASPKDPKSAKETKNSNHEIMRTFEVHGDKDGHTYSSKSQAAPMTKHYMLTREFNAEFDAHSTAFFKFNNSLRQGVSDAINQSNFLLKSLKFEQYYQILSDKERLDNYLKIRKIDQREDKENILKKMIAKEKTKKQSNEDTLKVLVKKHLKKDYLKVKLPIK